MRNFKIQKLSDNLGLIPISIITDGLSLLNNLFGGGRGSDFPNRKIKFQQWLTQFGFQGTDARFLNMQALNQLLFQDSGWQSAIQQFLSQTRHYLDGVNPVVNIGETNYTAQIIPFVDRIKAGGKNIGLPINPNTPNKSGFGNLPMLLLIGAGVFFISKQK